MKCHDDSQRSGRLAVTQPMPPPLTPRTERQLTVRADRPLRDPAHAVAFTTAVAVGGTGSVHRRTGMRAPLPFPAAPAAVPDRCPRLTARKTTAGVAGQSRSCLPHHSRREVPRREKKEVKMILKEPHARA